MAQTEQVAQGHPLRKAITVLRCWLGMVAAMMLWNALVSRGFLLHGWVRPLPYLVLSAVAGFWSARTWHAKAVVWCSAAMAVGCSMRGLEVLFFSDSSTRSRLTGISLWITLAGTALAFGILNLIAISRKEADEWAWSEQHSS